MTWKIPSALDTMPKLYSKWFCFYILILMDDKNTTSCGFTRLKFTLRNSFYPVKRHQKRSFLHILFASFCILPAFYILFYSNASNFYYRKYFLCLKLCQNYALWKIRVGVIRLCKCRAFKPCNYHELRENTDSIHEYQGRSEFFWKCLDRQGKYLLASLFLDSSLRARDNRKTFWNLL